jgi:phage-related tail fiber protein
VAGIAIGILLGGGAVVLAQATNVPHSFSAGEILSANDLNDNFGALQTGLNALATTVSTLQDSVRSTVPPGSVAAFAGEGTPDGWLRCDGAVVSRTVYSALFAAIGVAHGGGNGTTTFNLPDYRGRFLRGVDQGVGRDQDSATRSAPQDGNSAVTGGYGNSADRVGSIEQWSTGLPRSQWIMAADGEHVHNGEYVTTAGARFGLANGSFYYFGGGNIPPCGFHTHSISGGDRETRPENAYVNYIVKY